MKFIWIRNAFWNVTGLYRAILHRNWVYVICWEHTKSIMLQGKKNSWMWQWILFGSCKMVLIIFMILLSIYAITVLVILFQIKASFTINDLNIYKINNNKAWLLSVNRVDQVIYISSGNSPSLRRSSRRNLINVWESKNDDNASSISISQHERF
jgi:hypothetical protein